MYYESWTTLALLVAIADSLLPNPEGSCLVQTLLPLGCEYGLNISIHMIPGVPLKPVIEITILYSGLLPVRLLRLGFLLVWLLRVGFSAARVMPQSLAWIRSCVELPAVVWRCIKRAKVQPVLGGFLPALISRCLCIISSYLGCYGLLEGRSSKMFGRLGLDWFTLGFIGWFTLGFIGWSTFLWAQSGILGLYSMGSVLPISPPQYFMLELCLHL